MKTFCVIPAFNEEKNIAEVISQVKSMVDAVVAVDDGSSDRTADLAARAGAVVLKHLINRGQGAALRTGTRYCLDNGADIIIHFDADGQFLARDIERIIAPIKSGAAQVVFGSRFLNSEHSAAMPIFKKYFIMPLAKAVNKLFFDINLTDPQSGFRAMSAAAARLIDWKQDRMAHFGSVHRVAPM